MHAVFKAQLQQKQKKRAEDSLQERIKHVILSKFNGQITHINIVSSQLCMTTRTLQRKLTEEKTSYRKICQALRSELVSEILKTGKLKKGELASLLGYADADSLNRAFKSPKEINIK
jgi:AraC-like DNA-binding protein